MQARTLKIIAALLIISAIVMGVIGYKISQSDNARPIPTATAATVDHNEITYAQKVLVVNQNLQKGSVITEDLLELVPFPIPVDDGFTRPEDVTNKQLEFAVRKGDVLRKAMFEKQSLLASHIREGYRAIAVDVDEVVGAGGFLIPGDHVDVIFTAKGSKDTYGKSMARRILRNIKLLAYGSDIGEELPAPAVENKKARSSSSDNKESGKRSRSAVLEIAVTDINTLTLAESSGKLRLVAVGESELAQGSEGDSETASAEASQKDEATFIRSVTGLKPPAQPKSVYVYNGDQVETVRVPQ